MRNILAISTLSLMALATACSKSNSGTDNNNNNGGNTPPPVIKPLSIKLSRDTIENNGFESVKISVLDTTGADITSTSIISVDSVQQTGNVFFPSASKIYKITASSGKQVSSVKKLVVFNTSPSPFIQKVLVEDFTGAWCGYCPRIANQIDAYTPTHSECIALGIHDSQGINDPYSYQYVGSLEQAYKITGFPSAVINRSVTYSDLPPAAIQGQTGTWAAAGISITSDTSAAGTISGNILVKFNVTSDIPMNISVMLVENKLLANQTNYYNDATKNPYYGPNPIANFEYKNVLRKIYSSNLTDGDAIPATAIVTGNTYTMPYSFTTTGKISSGSSYTVNRANCKIIALVSFGKSNAVGKSGVINVQDVTVGTTKDFLQ